ncbi:sensor histidine kinase [Actinacidiphila epipremni]|uniref:histidine kinase n=1 Tax=Actinacidiphila epipremni TaxID=2053013 RepID=A0ABX0ZZ02_9ACTN|nr:nitrate- and nitrite sensing domain-containing protein [Actinacidiphila epipremni]NJP48441.1 HAMP domain-containing protein [Actinacidiphila epipremni]
MRNTRRAEAGAEHGPRGNFTPPQRPGRTPADRQADVPAPPDPGGRFSVRNWRVATRLNAILLIPVLVALVFGGFRVKSSVDTWHQADDAVRTAELVRAAATYSNALINERDLTVVPLLAGRRDDPAVTAARKATDTAAQAFDNAAARMPHEAGLERRMANFRSVEPQLASLRKSAYTKQLSGVQTEEWYVKIQHPLMELANELGYGTSNITAYGRTLYADSLAKAAESLTRSIGMHILVEKDPSPDELALLKTALGSYQYLEGIALEEYNSGGTTADVQRLKDAQNDALQKGREQTAQAKDKALAAGQQFVVPPSLTKMVTEIATPGRTVTQLRAEGITPETYFAASTLSFDAYRTVEVALADQAAGDAGKIASNAKRDAIVNSVIVVVALIAAFIVAGMVARTMSRSMRRLRGAAFDIAETRLPALVDQLSRTDPGRVDTEVAPIPIATRDEIGEVARAFDQVHREAVRLAAEQALLRGNVNAIFTNLSLRNQGLIQRQLELITDLENNEADPDQLENLFKMDHLATRMRRNGENLLVLAGEEPARQWNQAVPLVDVLRAAASEVEAYERIELVGIPETDIHGSAVSDLVHLLAELLENATTFSSPQTKVRVTATRLPDGRVMIEIHDKGIGLTAEDFADINHRLASPPTVDVEIAKRMGLFVVGRLSDRHGIRVQLRPSGEQAGTTSLVMLPEPITHGGGGDELADGESDFTVSRIVPEAPAEGTAYGTPELTGPTAAELGFDDSRYEQGGTPAAGTPAAGTPGLDPVGRSLRREGRRAQLEAATAHREDEQPAPAAAQEPQPQPYREEPYEPASGYEAAQPYGTGYDAGFPQQTYAQGLQGGFDAQGYPVPQEQGYPAAQEQGYGAPQDQGYAAPYAEQGYPQGFEQPAPQGYGQNGFFAQPYGSPGGDQQPAQGEWPGPDAGVTESVPPLPEQPSESVGSPSLTDAGLPRRDRKPRTSPQEQPAQESPTPQTQPLPETSGWRSNNDDNWQRAESVREPKAGGVTPSGLPRRVPKANLVPGAATQTPQGGPQVSRAPEDVRGRLSNLRRGVQQGRSAGTDTNGQAGDPHFGGPQNQEH